MGFRSKAGHIGGALSVMDILVALYYNVMNIGPKNADCRDRDRFLLSKGHSAASLYAVLADRGFFDKRELERFSVYDSPFIGHPNNEINGVEMNTGALGHGLSLGVGMALAARLDKRPYRTYVVMGDGELAEGSNWEAVMAASHFKLDNLCAIVDRNKLQISGPTESVVSLENLLERFSSFGWNVLQVDGHDHDALLKAFDSALGCKGRPSVLIAHTVKGKGISFMENRVEWHHRVPDEAEYKRAVAELERGMREAEG